MRTAGIILDVYDDPQGRVLREKLAGAALPEKLASACLLDAADLEQLPDRLFGLVGQNNGEVLRKYAMHDEAHVTTSIIYFMECGRRLLPEDASIKVAGNLTNACAWYGIDPPDELVKEALGVMRLGMGALGAAELKNVAKESGTKRQAFQEDFRRAQYTGKTASGNIIDLTANDESEIVSSSGSVDAVPGHVQRVLVKRDQHDATTTKLDNQIEQKTEQVQPYEKTADLTGTEIMPRGILSKSVRSSPTKNVPMPAKVSSWRGVDDLTGREAPVAYKVATYQRFALPHLRAYPLDTPEQVKTAEAYFDENLQLFPLPERRVFAHQTYSRANELGLKVAGRMLDYAGEDYGPYIDAELLARAQSFEGTGSEAIYEVLAEKRAELDPMVMVQVLLEADVKTGADRSYDRPGTGLRNPYEAVYGSAKVAETQPTTEESFSWVGGSDYVSGFQLSALAASGSKLDHTFGAGFGKSFSADPIGIFKSLPDPQKVILSRLASDIN